MTIDFGDDWHHVIKVEKIIEREERYAEVIKYKGPNMIEDCGGIWNFYDYIDEAEPFDMEAVNKRLASWVYSEVVETDSEAPYMDFSEYEKELQENPPEISSLTDVFLNYSKEELKQITQIHHFSGYSKFNKPQLAEWLKNHLLETYYMEKVIKNTLEEEFRLFESAITEKGVIIPEQFIESSLLLCTYGGYQQYEYFTVFRWMYRKNSGRYARLSFGRIWKKNL